MNKATLNELHGAVSGRLRVVSDHALRDSDPAAHLEQLKAAAARLEELISTLPDATDPTLRHYLERQSYVKALDWLEKALARGCPGEGVIPSSSEN